MENGESQEKPVRASKRKLKAKLEKEKNKVKRLKTLISTSLQIRPKRARIPLTLPNFVDLSAQKIFAIFSDPVDLVGFKWILSAGQPGSVKNADKLGIVLIANPPPNYEGPFEFQVDLTFRLFNALSSEDLWIERENLKMNPRPDDDPPIGLEIFGLIKLEKLVDRANGFLQEDGSIQMELDFTVKKATLDHLLVEDNDEEESASEDEEEDSGEESSSGEEDGKSRTEED